MNVADKLTVSRFGMAAALIACLSIPFPGAMASALIIFILAALTDALDGHLARTVYGTSNFGKLLDPLADKVLTAAAFIGFVGLKVMPAWMVVLILSREMMVTGLRLLAAEKGVVVGANRWGKQKTIWQMVYIIAVLAALTFGFFDSLRVLFGLFALAVTALTVWSGVIYFRQNRTLIHNRN
jgi:CDP-diacylglycerol--glycerol-3-phosphate 3-phosphatidyltransferase